MTLQKKHIELERSLTQQHFDRFARLSGDDNPIHVDPVFAANTRFERTVCHGLLLISILRGMADRLAPASKQLAQHIVFLAPTFAGEPMRFLAEIETEEEGVTSLRVSSTRVMDGVVTCEGTMTMQRLGELT